jgi:hypothetical protein
VIATPLGVRYYTQCVEALATRNRGDLVAPLQRKIDAYRRREPVRRLRAFARRVIGL